MRSAPSSAPSSAWAEEGGTGVGAVTPEAETRARRLQAEERPRRSRAAGQTASRGLGPQAEAGVPRGRPGGSPLPGVGPNSPASSTAERAPALTLLLRGPWLHSRGPRPADLITPKDHLRVPPRRVRGRQRPVHGKPPETRRTRGWLSPACVGEAAPPTRHFGRPASSCYFVCSPGNRCGG